MGQFSKVQLAIAHTIQLSIFLLDYISYWVLTIEIYMYIPEGNCTWYQSIYCVF